MDRARAQGVLAGRSGRLIHALLLAGAFGLPSGCGPRFQNVREYAPPETPEGLRCASACSGALDECRSICEARFQDCQHVARANADQRYARLYDRWAWERRSWEAQYAHERWRKDEIDRRRAAVRRDLDDADRGCDRGKAEACAQEQALKRELERLPDVWIPAAPVPPIATPWRASTPRSVGPSAAATIATGRASRAAAAA